MKMNTRVSLFAFLVFSHSVSVARVDAAPGSPAKIPPSQVTIKVRDVVATGVNERFRRMRISVTAPLEFAGQRAEIRQDERVLGSAVLQIRNEKSSAEFPIPLPTRGQNYSNLSVQIGTKARAALVLPDIEKERQSLLESAPLRTSFVFSGEDFPKIDFDQPSFLEDALGSYTIQTRFYDAFYNRVERASATGRYGAVVEIKAQNGAVSKRYVTLYRQSRVLDWKSVKPLFTGELPPELGIDASVLREREAVWSDYLKWQFVNGLERDSAAGALLSALHEAKPGDGSGSWNNPWHRDETWWYKLKKKLGDTKPTRYLVDFPTEYDADKTKKWPLVLFLHGSGERGDDLKILRRNGPPKLVAQGQKFPFVLVSPQAPQGYLLATQLIEVLDEVAAKYRVDIDRVYVTGLSMGGNGTWFLALEYPERFAAIAPVAASGDPGGAARLKNIPVWYFVGDKDDKVPQKAQQMVAAMKAAGVPYKFTIYPETGHVETWEKAYSDPSLYTWMLAQKRTPKP